MHFKENGALFTKVLLDLQQNVFLFFGVVVLQFTFDNLFRNPNNHLQRYSSDEK